MQTYCIFGLVSSMLVNVALSGGEVLVLIACVCVCVSVTTISGATDARQAQLRYQQKALDVRIKIKVGISLKDLSSRVMTVFSLPRKLGACATKSTSVGH